MNFDRAVQALCDAGVEFIIIGGWSAILHGSAHVTSDLGVFFVRGRGNLRRLVEALAPYHPRLADLPEGLPFIWDEATFSNGTIFTLTTELGRIDLLGEVSGLARSMKSRRRRCSSNSGDRASALSGRPAERSARASRIGKPA